MGGDGEPPSQAAAAATEKAMTEIRLIPGLF
jgi:hypothetical protein